jgi:hypothetical protein
MDIFIYGIVGLGALAVITTLVHTDNKKTKELEKLEEEIIRKKHLIHTLDQHIENQTIDRTVMLTKSEIAVLDLYDKSNIKIPIDIVEDLSTMKLDSETDIYNFIEIQRRYWKLENTKKVFRKGVK